VGTLEEGPVTFLVEVEQGGERKRLLEKTVTTAHRWEPAPVALDGFASRRVTISLSISAQNEGALDFWGAPAVRDRARPSQATGPRPPRGVILFVADTLRRDHLKDYGYPRDTAPHLSRLVSEGALFRDNQSQATWTKVSVSSILTSLYPTTHGIRTRTDRLPASATTLAEIYPEWELFDHQKDPLNLVNIAGEHPEVVERLSRILEDWYKFAQAAKLPSDEGVTRP
jgi:hypothetical protein